VNIEYSNKWFSVLKEDKYYYVSEENSSNGAVVLVVKDADSYVFVKQFRYAVNSEMIEVPRGYGNPGETSIECAIREVKEETGYSIRKENLRKLGAVSPNSAMLTSKIDIFRAEVSGIDEGEVLDIDEVSEVVIVPISELSEWVSSNQITDGFTLSALALDSMNK